MTQENDEDIPLLHRRASGKEPQRLYRDPSACPPDEPMPLHRLSSATGIGTVFQCVSPGKCQTVSGAGFVVRDANSTLLIRNLKP